MAPSTSYYFQELAEAARPGARKAGRSFSLLLAGTVAATFALGILLERTPFSLDTPVSLARKIRVSVNFSEEQQKTRPKPRLEKAPEPVRQQETAAEPAPAAQKTVVVRKVYGLKRVFAQGLGAGGSGEAAVVSKLGNTLEKEPDTLTATRDEVRGEVASVSAVTAKPAPLSIVKPEYTEEMKKHRIQGVISARILVDIDGRVKRIEVLNDLGHGTREAVEEACRKLLFKPAMQGDKPVAVWIVFKFRFVLQED